jgi:hypothetical protein
MARKSSALVRGAPLPRMISPLILASDSAALTNRSGLPRPSLVQCLLLAGLLHLWLVVLVGTTPGGGNRPGDALWNGIQVRLIGPGPSDSAGRADVALPHGGPVGRAPEPRFGGDATDAPARPSPEAGAATLGDWQARPTLSPPGQAAPAAGPTDAAARSAPPPVLTGPSPIAAPTPQPTERPPAPTPMAPEAPRPAPTDPTPAPSTAPRLAPVDTVPAPVLERPESAQRDIANPAADAVPMAQSRPAPAPRQPDRLPAMPIVSAEDLTPLPMAVPTPVPPVIRVPSPPTPRTAASPETRPARESLPPVVEAPALPPRQAEPPPTASVAPLASPVLQPAPTPVVTPPPVPDAPVPDAVVQPPIGLPEPPARALAPLAPLRPIELGSVTGPDAPALNLPPVRATAAPVVPAAIGIPAPPVTVRADTAPRPGADRTAAPPATGRAPLNLTLPQGHGAATAQSGLGGQRALNLVPPPPQRKSALTEGIERAARPDCRKAYSGMGVLAVVPLATDALREGGCRW